MIMMQKAIPPQILVVQKISSALIHERDVETMLQEVLSIIDDELRMHRGTFALLYGDTLKIEVSHGLSDSEKKLGFYHLGEGITGHVAATGRSHVIPDLRNDNRFLNRTGARHYTTPVAFICVPLLHRERVIGTLSVDRPVTAETDLASDVAFLEILANITADAAAECIHSHEEKKDVAGRKPPAPRSSQSGAGQIDRQLPRNAASLHATAAGRPPRMRPF